ncbi:MAG TPA: NADP-dependent phosphogluconate dehydrogenase, partial [Anaerolineae bacterium]
VGISGGEQGARFGPSIMPGGPLHAYERVRPIFESIAAKVNGEPCVTYLGPRSAGHYVKIVHNGIEYAMLAVISEAYDLLKRGLGFDNTQLSEIFARWNSGPINSFLIEITSKIFMQKDQLSGKCLVDVILDEAGQKGTGKWTSEDAMALQVPVLTIDASVAMRNLSMLKQERENASHILTGPTARFEGDRDLFLKQVENALYVAFLATFAQGMALLRQASDAYDYDLNLEMIASIWRGGCIIRAGLLEDIRGAYHANPNLPNLLVDPHLAQQVNSRQNDLRSVVRTAADLGLPAPAFMTSLGYYDGYRSAWLPANLIQAQRDYFGAHTYERIDEKGVFHTAWSADHALGNLDE